MAWTEPVYDRSNEDVLLGNKKAYINAVDLNRIEANCEELAELLGVSILVRSWTREGFPAVSQLARIRGNIQTLREAYYTYRATPDTPENPLTHREKWNAAERILADLHELWDKNRSALTYAGEGFAGDQIGVM